MGIVARMADQRSASSGAGTPSNPSYWLQRIFAGMPTASGRRINEDTAMGIITVYACVRVIAETLATLPLFVYRNRDDGGKERARFHPLYEILHSRPNDEMTSATFLETLFGHAVLWGNGYAQIVRSPVGAPIELIPLRPDRMRVIRTTGGELRYHYQSPIKGDRDFLPSDIFHLKGLSKDGLTGMSVIGIAREAAGLALAAEEYAARFFGNDGRPGGIIKTKGTVTTEQLDNIRQSWNSEHRGSTNAFKVAILEEDFDWVSTSMPLADMQFIDLRKYTRTELAALFRVPPHKIGDLERATFSNIEHQSLEFVRDTIRPWAVRFEQEAARVLFPRSEKGEYFAEHNLDGLLRGDTSTRYESYSKGRNWGWLSVNDIRKLENMNPIDGGDVYLAPLNMVPTDQLGQQPGDETKSLPPAEQRSSGNGSVTSRRKLGQRYRRLFLDAATRMLKREVADVRAAADRHLLRRDVTTFDGWLETYYRDLPALLGRIWLPVYATYADAIADDAAAEVGVEPDTSGARDRFIRDYAVIAAATYAGRSAAQLRAVVKTAITANTDPLEAVTTRLDAWLDTRADRVTDNEIAKSGNAVAKQEFKRAGVRRLKWVASGKSCPFCRKLDGTTAGIEETFVDEGAQIDGNDGDTPLKTRSKIGHAPLHRGCDCGIAPA